MHESITEGLALIFRGIDLLRDAFPNRAFTIDGRLVGDIGEVIAALEYGVRLDAISRPDHDACSNERQTRSDQGDVQRIADLQDLP